MIKKQAQGIKKNAVYNFTLMILSLFLIKMAIVLVMIAPGGALAADLTTQIGFGSISEGSAIKGMPISTYFLAFYNYAMGLIGVLSAVVIMWGGFVWITAGGNQTRVSTAQSWIGAALSGLILALSAVVILDIINPKLTKVAPLNVETVTLEEADSGVKKATVLFCCEHSSGNCQNYYRSNDKCPGGWTKHDSTSCQTDSSVTIGNKQKCK